MATVTVSPRITRSRSKVVTAFAPGTNPTFSGHTGHTETVSTGGIGPDYLDVSDSELSSLEDTAVPSSPDLPRARKKPRVDADVEMDEASDPSVVPPQPTGLTLKIKIPPRPGLNSYWGEEVSLQSSPCS